MKKKIAKVPFFSLDRARLERDDDVMRGIDRVLRSGIYIKGPEVESFEREFAEWLDVKYAVGAACGFDALELALLAAGVGRDDEVITAANGCPATPMSITAIGARPVFVDCDDSYNIDLDLLEKAVTKKTKAVLFAHLYGRPVDMDRLMAIAHKRGLKVLEDCAQAHGSEWKEKRVGTFGDLACFSFYPTKNLGAVGDAGIVVTNSKSFEHKVRMVANYGEEKRFNSKIQGVNSRLDPIQAAILKVKLKRLDESIDRRREIARTYIDAFSNLGITLPIERENEKHSYHLFVIRLKNRDRLRDDLAHAGIGSDVHYPIPFHKLGAFLRYGKGVRFPKAEKFAKTILSLPMHPYLTDHDIDMVVDAVRKSLKK